MSEVWSALDAREQAVLIWFVLFFTAVLLIRDVRRGLPDIAATLVRPPLSLLLLGAVLYVGGLVAGAAVIGLWTLPLVGVTVLWFFGNAIVTFFNSHDAVTDPAYFRKAIRGGVWLVLILEAVVNLAVFPLAVELFILPLLLFVVLLGAAAAARPDLAIVKTFADVLLGLFGAVAASRTLYALATDFESYATLETLMRLLLPPALTLAFLGYVYLLSRYMIWEHRRLHPVAVRGGKRVESSARDHRRSRTARERRKAA